MSFHHIFLRLLLALAIPLAVSAQTPSSAGVSAAAPATAASDQALVRGPAGAVSLQQFEAAVQHLIPTEQRAEFFASPRSIENLAMALYGRQALEAQARQQGFESRPEIQRVVAVAAQQALTDQWLAHQLAARVPAEQQLEQYARSVYQAQHGSGTPSLELKLRHIMIAVQPNLPDPQARAKAEAVLAELKGGADFQTLARRESTDKASAARGGEMKPIITGPRLSAFEAAAVKLDKPGQISEVVKSQDGYHIIQLIDKQAVDGFERQREGLMAQARAKLEGQARSEIWTKAQEGAQVEATAVQSLVRTPAAK